MKYFLTFLLLLMCLTSFGQDQQKIDSLNVVIDKYSRTVDWKELIEAYFEKGKLYHSEKNYEAAAKQFLRVDYIAKQHSHIDKNTVMALLHRANISRSTFTYDGVETANILGEEALSDAKKLNNEALVYTIYKDLAYTKNLNDDHAEAKKMLDLAFQYYLKKEDSKSISWLYRIYAGHYNDVDSLKKSEAVRKEYLKYFRAHTDSIELAKALSGLGDFYRMKLNQCQKAMPYLQEAMVIYENIQLTNIRAYLYLMENLAICHANRNEYQLGYEYYKQAYNLRKDIVREANDVTTRQLEAKYQTEKKDQEIALLKSENDLIEQKRKNQRNTLLGVTGTTTIVGLFLFVMYRNRQKTNTKLKELDKIKSNFFTNISHEFRTPLTLISDPINDTLDDDTLSDKKRQQFTVAKQNSERLLSLVNQILDLSKIDAGQLKLHIQNANALKIISALSESFKYSAKQKNITYSVIIKRTEENIWFDKDALEKITINLMSNALKYTPKNGSVTCNAHLKDNKLFLEVKNTGKVLTTDELDNIFQRFYQTNEQNEGTGIGLALVKELVELHKGTIKVTSIPNEFTAFTVILPVDKNSFQNEQFVNVTSSKTITKTPFVSPSITNDEEELVDNELPILLIVEDNVDLRALLKQTFEASYNVLIAANGNIGVKLALEHIPDLIISDIMMPEKDGVTLTKELKTDERSSHIPIILLTAKADIESQFDGIDTGADDYITKPFDKKLLALKVEKLIESRKKLQLRYSQEVILRPKDIAITSIDELFLERLQKVLDEKLVESSCNIEEFSKALGMSRMQLHRKLKALTGLSASEFIRSQRLKLAAQLLKKSEINVSQVGYSVGFNDHAYFSKCFKEMYHCTPSEFAASNN